MDLVKFFEIFGTHEKVIDFFIKNGFIYKDFKYEKENCGSITSLAFRKNNWVFRCHRSGCGAEKSAFYGTILFNSRVDYSRIMICAYLWINKSPLTKINNMSGLNHITVSYYVNLFKEIIISSLDPEDTIIGGDGVVVEIDETKFVKINNNNKEIWIFWELNEVWRKGCF